MEYKKTNSQNDPGTWQTGRTEPPRRHSALISVLLVLVILLSGISTALSILNFKLYKSLKLAEPAPQVSFSQDGAMPDTAALHPEDLDLYGFGLKGTAIPGVYQRYYKLPSGIYVNQVSASSEAASKGIVVGDIITALGDVAITEDLTQQQLAELFVPGQEVALYLYRNGIESCLTLNWNP